MNRDLAVPVLLGLLALAALPSTGLVDAAAFLRAPGAFLTVALLATAAFALLVVPWLQTRGRGGALRIVGSVLAALPFLAFGLLETPAPPDGVLLPGWGWLLAILAGMVLVALPLRVASVAGAVVLAFLGADALLGTSGLHLLPTTWVADAGPVAFVGGSGQEAEGPSPREERLEGLRRGAPVVVDAVPFGVGPGPWFAPATEGLDVRRGPLVLLLDGRPAVVGEHPGEGTFLPADRADWDHPLTLDAFDAVVVLPGAWPADADYAASRADALATYVRRGGLLVGPAPDRTWPPPLARRLGRAAAAHETGPAGRRAFGLGVVIRAGSELETREVLAWGTGRPRLLAVFDTAEANIPFPAPPGASARPLPRPRSLQGILLIVYALVAGLMDRVLRGPAPRLLGVLGPAVAITLGLVWTSPGEPALRVAGVVFDLGGGGGRRLEAVALEAGPGGWAGRVQFQGGGFVRALRAQARSDGRLHLAPGRRAWVLREGVSSGHLVVRPDPQAAFLRQYLVGPVDAEQLELGRGPDLSVQVEGHGPVRSWALTVR